MKKVPFILLGLALSAVALPSTVLAAKADGPKAKFFAKYDKNHNGLIEEDEKDAIRKDYAANPEGDLKRFDKNHDGKLDDQEIAAIKPPSGKGKNGAAVDFFAKYDKNRNGVIDADEKEAIRKDYAAKPEGELKQFDRNKDGKLDDEEIAAIKAPTPRKGGAKGDKAGVLDTTAKSAEKTTGAKPAGAAEK